MEIEINYHSNGYIYKKYPIQPKGNNYIVGMIQTYKYGCHEIRRSIFIGKDPETVKIHGPEITFKY